MELLRNTLDVIETVNSDDDLDAAEACLKLFDTVFYRLLFEVLQR